MMFSEVTGLKGKTIDAVQTWSNVVAFKFDSGETVAYVKVEAGQPRLLVASKGPEGARPGIRVYRGDFMCSEPLPDERSWRFPFSFAVRPASSLGCALAPFRNAVSKV